MLVAERSTGGGGRPVFRTGRKVSQVQMVQLWQAVQADPACPSRRVLQQMVLVRQEVIPVSLRQVNRLRARWQLSRGKGRPRRQGVATRGGPGGAVVQVMPHLPFVGVHLFAAWLQEQVGWTCVVALLQQAITRYSQEHPAADFPLLAHKRETLARRWAALLYAPLLGVGKLTEFDVKEHGLGTLLGRGYQSSTLNQFLGQLERIDAGAALRPALAPAAAGRLVYVDGHMIAFWTTVSMHKGKITMLGRIMAGSNAVIAHNEAGQALHVEYQPPDIRLPSMILEYCAQVVAATGIKLFVIDREINSVAMAAAFAERGWGLLSMLDKNEYEGLSSWTTTRIGELADGSPVYSGQWQEPRPEDVREFVLVETGERVLAYWGTAKVKETLAPLQWPDLYRVRTVVQEHSFKRMIEHGALNVNYGIKKIMGPDRHQQRARVQLEEALAVAEKKAAKAAQLVAEQAEKVAQSTEKGHQQRLVQRQRQLVLTQAAWQKAREKKEALVEKVKALGPPRERADRDFRKQRIMTFRSLLLENMLIGFLMALWGKLAEKVSLESMLTLLFQRSGSSLETDQEIIYWVNTVGLSTAYQRRLAAVVQALTALNLTCRGKPIRVRLRGAPP